jgi:hypothetical protein
MKTIILYFAQNIEKEGVNWVEDIFVVKEHSWNIAEIFAIDSLSGAINLEERNITISVYFPARWMSDLAL